MQILHNMSVKDCGDTVGTISDTRIFLSQLWADMKKVHVEIKFVN